jgi:hypothetical protein
MAPPTPEERFGLCCEHLRACIEERSRSLARKLGPTGGVRMHGGKRIGTGT